MEKKLIRCSDGTVYRILGASERSLLVINCSKFTMPEYKERSILESCEEISENELPIICGFDCVDFASLPFSAQKKARFNYSAIASVIPIIGDVTKRSSAICEAAELFGLSKQTIRRHLCRYLIFQDIAVLAPNNTKQKKELTPDQKNMRWALNKFFYTRYNNSLNTAYTHLIKAKYTDDSGNLTEHYPSFSQFRYYYYKTRKMAKFYISRNGLSDYKRNKRPLLGDGVQEYAPNIGTAMLDGTVCDIYLVDDTGKVAGRPLLVTACDANTSLCMGYSLQWEGGLYSLRELMLNMISDKTDLCRSMGIAINSEQWPSSELPGIIVTDRGREYTSQTFEQIAELGVTVVNLSPYRPDLKGPVEKLFDLVQSEYKKVLKGKGVIMPDFRERGARDYRKDSCLTISEFERIIVRCIIYYNSQRVLNNYPYTEEMLRKNVKPYASDIWNFKKTEDGANLISVNKQQVILTMLPRTKGVFTRFGLKVNNLRYNADGFKEKYLSGGECSVSYNPDDCSFVWLQNEYGEYTEFHLIEERFAGKSVNEVKEFTEKQKALVKSIELENLQAKVQLLDFIETVATKETVNADSTDIRQTHNRAKNERHRDIGGAVLD